MISVSKDVAKLFRAIIGLTPDQQVFCNHWASSKHCAIELAERGAKVAAANDSFEMQLKWQREEKDVWDHVISLTQADSLAMFNPQERYHAAFSGFPFIINEDEKLDQKKVQFQEIRDQMLFFQCSKGKEEAKVPAHILGIESLLRSVMAGGYIGAVVPARWTGRDMSYMRWWSQRAATVAEITLPESAVSYTKRTSSYLEISEPYNTYPSDPVNLGTLINHRSIELAAPGKWKLMIWSKQFIPEEREWHSNTSQYFNFLEFAKYRHPSFVKTIEIISPDSLKEIRSQFQKSEWFICHTQHWLDLLKEHATHTWFGTHRQSPLKLKDPAKTWYFQPTSENTCRLHIMPQEKIDNLPQAIQVRPGNRTKLSAGVRPAARMILHDIKVASGYIFPEDGDQPYTEYDIMFKLKHWQEIHEKVLRDICNRDGIPAVTPEDFNKIRKQERWLNIQLTPNERTIPVHGKYSEEEESDIEWETIYGDMGMDATFPEVIKLWRKRAKDMKLDEYLAGFQLEDVVHSVCHDGIFIGNVMGTGKTRTSMFDPILATTEKILIVAPKRLIGEWQDEIESTLQPFARRVKRDWSGKIIRSDINVIEYAKDCIDLRRFNIISLDTLKRTPKDGQFYRCPDCQAVAYQALVTNRKPTCCGDPYLLRQRMDHPDACCNKILAWKVSNAERELRKRRFLSDDGKPIHWQCYRSGYWNGDIWISYSDEKHAISEEKPLPGKPVFKKHKKTGETILCYHVKDTFVRDERPPKPVIPEMEPVRNMFKKMVKVIDEVRVDENGEKHYTYKMVPRPFHAAWTFAAVLRNRVGAIIVDEALNVSNPDSKRTQALCNLTGKRRRLLSGTPMKGMPQDMVGLINWVAKRAVFPEYRPFDPFGIKRFLDRYKAVVRIGGTQTPSGQIVGGTDKQIPVVKNPELFQAELAPILIRHVRNEPQVLESFPRIRQKFHDRKLEMDEQHRVFYQKWLRKFEEWWIKMKEEEEGKKVSSGELITKMLYLRAASSIPHFMFDRLKKSKDQEVRKWMQEIQPYKGPPTAKMKECRRLLKKIHEQGDKGIFFAYYVKMCDYQNAWATERGYRTMSVHGGVPITTLKGQTRSQRHLKVDEFRRYNYDAMFAGIMALNEGMNIPEANHGIICDYTWKPADIRQAIGRMLRPEQSKTVHSYYMMHAGTMEEYMAAWSLLKAMGGDEAIDYMDVNLSASDVPDIHQYAQSIVDGTEEALKRKMWLAVEQLRNRKEQEGDDDATL